MKDLVRARRLSWPERAILAEATAALAVSAMMLSTLPFRRVVRRAGRVDLSVGATEDSIAPVRWAVCAVARRVPWRAKCFEQGLAAQWMLRRRGIAGTLYYGLARNGTGRLKAHVWVRAGDLDVVGCENAGDFAEMARFP